MGKKRPAVVRRVCVPNSICKSHRWHLFERDIMDDITKHVIGDSTEISLDTMRSDSRSLRDTNARMLAMTIASVLHPKWRLQHIGAYFNREISDVRCAAKLVSNAVKHASPTSLRREALRVCARMGLLPAQLILKN